MLMMTPRKPLTLPSPRIGSMPHSTLATSEMRMARSLTRLTTVRAMSSSFTVMARLRTMISVEPEFRKPPVLLPDASLAALSNCS